MICFCKKNFFKKISFGKTKLCFHCSLFGFFKTFINTQRVVKNQYSSPQPPKNQVKKLWEIILLTESSSFSGKVLHELEHRVNTATRINEPIFHVCVCVFTKPVSAAQCANETETIKLKSQVSLGSPRSDLCTGFSPVAGRS